MYLRNIYKVLKDLVAFIYSDDCSSSFNNSRTMSSLNCNDIYVIL